MRKDSYKYVPLVLVSLFSSSPIYAQSAPPQLDGTVIQRLVDTVTSKLLPIAGLLAFIFVVYGGYMWIISAGDPEKIKRSQGILTWAIIGLVFTIIVGLILKTILDAVN